MAYEASVVQDSNMADCDPKAEFDRLREEHIVMLELFKTVVSSPPESLSFAQGFRERVRQHRFELARLRSYLSEAALRNSGSE